MKIEVCESLCSSWLKHIKGCQLVNQNWKLSPLWSSLNLTLANNLYDATYHLFSVSSHKKQPLDKFLKTAECDVIGISFHNIATGKYSIHAADIAFHSGSLGYNVSGYGHASVQKVLQKTLRTALSILCYLNLKEGDIYFLSPYITPKDKNEILKRFIDLKNISDSFGCNFEYHLICNEDFGNDVVMPLIEHSKEIKDDNELWLRSYQSISISLAKCGLKINDVISGKLLTIKPSELNKLKQKASKAKSNKSKSKSNTKVTPVISSTNSNNRIIMPTTYSSAHPAGMKIGEYARQIAAVITNGKVSNAELINLQDKTYSNSNFGITYPVLVIETNPHDDTRYYKNPIIYNGVSYLLCKEWADKKKQWDGLERFFLNH